MSKRFLFFLSWASVTDVPCLYKCRGTLRWAENGYVPGYRICDACGRHYALRDRKLTATGRRGGWLAVQLRRAAKDGGQ
jgi:hypothetical protein